MDGVAGQKFDPSRPLSVALPRLTSCRTPSGFSKIHSPKVTPSPTSPESQGGGRTYQSGGRVSTYEPVHIPSVVLLVEASWHFWNILGGGTQ